MDEDSLSHQKVLRSLKKLRVLGYDILVEERGSRLDLPNELIQAKRKGVAQRKRNLCYIDAMIHAERVPRVLIEVVDNNPTGPNGMASGWPHRKSAKQSITSVISLVLRFLRQ